MADKQVKKVKTTKKKKKNSLLSKGIVVTCLLLLSAFLLVNVIKEVYTTITLQQQLAEVQTKLQEVQDENTYLTEQKEKLQDPDYVEVFARGTYQLSKDDDQIFHLPANPNK